MFSWETLTCREIISGSGASNEQACFAFREERSGATAIEYGLIAAGIAVAIIATVQALGTNRNNTFSTVSTALK